MVKRQNLIEFQINFMRQTYFLLKRREKNHSFLQECHVLEGSFKFIAENSLSIKSDLNRFYRFLHSAVQTLWNIHIWLVIGDAVQKT